jgi:hypothetical protein
MENLSISSVLIMRRPMTSSNWGFNGLPMIDSVKSAIIKMGWRVQGRLCILGEEGQIALSLLCRVE